MLSTGFFYLRSFGARPASRHVAALILAFADDGGLRAAQLEPAVAGVLADAVGEQRAQRHDRDQAGHGVDDEQTGARRSSTTLPVHAI